MSKSNTQQMVQQRDDKGRIIGGPPPAGFNKHPENRNPGGWKPETTISYQYRRYMAMSKKEFDKAADDDDMTMAMVIAYNRVKAARDSKLGLPDSKEITDRTEGKAPQSIDLTSGGEPIKTSLVEFIGTDAVNSGTSKDTNTSGV